MPILRRTRISLFYLAGYLCFGGTAFLFLPDLSLKLFVSTGDYEPVMVRTVGVLLLALGILISQIIRHRAEALYPATLVVRPIIIVAFAVFYATTGDPMMLILCGIVSIGWLTTLLSYRADRAE